MPIGWHLNAIAMPGLRWNPPFLGYLVGHVYRTYNAYCEGKAGSTPLERLREKRGGQAPRSYPFGAVGFLKPIHPSKWPGQRLVLCHFLGMRYVTGGGCLGYPFSVDAEGYREVIKQCSALADNALSVSKPIGGWGQYVVNTLRARCACLLSRSFVTTTRLPLLSCATRLSPTR